MRRLWPKLAIGLLLGLAVVIGLALLADLRAVAGLLHSFQWRYAPAILGLTLVNYGLRFVKWHYYVRLVGARQLAWTHSLRIFVAGFPLALSPGKLAEPMKAVWLNQASGVPVARGVPVVAAERISDGLAVLLLSTLGVLAYPQYWPGFVVVLAGLLGIVVISQVRPLALWLLGLGQRLPGISRFSSHLREFYEGSYQLLGPRSTLLAVALGTVSWLAEGIGFYLVLRGLGLPASASMLGIAVFVLSFATIVGAVSSLPGGLGAAEASIAGLLALTLAAPADIAAAATLLIRFFTLWFGVALGLGVLLTSRGLLGLESPAPAGAPDSATP
jgi:glycosyltransferase 2 family protein